jgi:oxygen-independent coproporphyrinogen III oxidase
MLAEQTPPITSLYVHVPFCARKCEYCAFYSEASSGEVIGRYVEALLKELRWVGPDLKPKTIFFGGGTPSLLNLRHWQKIFHALQKLDLLGAEEFTIECNPATVSPDKARLWRDYGVNRVSMGVQSFVPALLERLGRIHTRKMAYQSYEVLRKSGFRNINLDLMFAIPGQTMGMWRETLGEAVGLQPEHLSSYELTYEEDTPMYEQLKAGKYSVNEDLACAMYEELLACATQSGFVQYEVSNFGRNTRNGARDGIPKFACRHNVNYWRGIAYYGLGPSACSFVKGVRTQNVSNTVAYCEQIEKGAKPIESTDELPPLQRAGELAAFGLRMNTGWPLEDFKKLTGYDLREEWKAECDELVARAWAQLDKERFHLTTNGMRFADAAGEMFLR